MFECSKCTSSFNRKDNLTRHEKSHSNIRFSCNKCIKTFKYKSDLTRHEKNVHFISSLVQQQTIEIAPNVFAPITPAGPSNDTSDTWADDGFNEDLFALMNEGTSTAVKHTSSGNSASAILSKKVCLDYVNVPSFVEVKSTFNRKVVWYYRKNIENYTNYVSFLSTIKPELLEKLVENTHDHPIKYNLKLESMYNRSNVENSSENRTFKTLTREVFIDIDIRNMIETDFVKLKVEEENYTSKGSGFTLQCIDGLLLGVYMYTPTGGSSYIPLPTDIHSKHVVINPQNSDNHCFKWTILAKHTTGANRHRVGDNYTEHELNYNFT